MTNLETSLQRNKLHSKRVAKDFTEAKYLQEAALASGDFSKVKVVRKGDDKLNKGESWYVRCYKACKSK